MNSNVGLLAFSGRDRRETSMYPCLRDGKNPDDGKCHRNISDGISILLRVLLVRKDRPEKYGIAETFCCCLERERERGLHVLYPVSLVRD